MVNASLRINPRLLVCIIVIVALSLGLLYSALIYSDAMGKLERIKADLRNMASIQLKLSARYAEYTLSRIAEEGINESGILSNNTGYIANLTLTHLTMIDEELIGIQDRLVNLHLTLGILLLYEDGKVVEKTKTIINELGKIIQDLSMNIELLKSTYQEKIAYLKHGSIDPRVLENYNNRLNNTLKNLKLKIDHLDMLIKTIREIEQLDVYIRNNQYSPLMDKVISDLLNYESIANVKMQAPPGP